MTRAPHIPPIATGGKPPEACCVLHSQLLQRSVFGVQCSVLFPSQLATIQDSRNHNNFEDNRYTYHSDHLGSSAFLTDIDGNPTQHLQYLPFGEPFIEQRSVTDYYTPYTFSAKERDLETGYSYFGARYYNSQISVWLSVDPLSDKYPSMSPYMYCAGNPVMLVDPDGREIDVTELYRKDKNGEYIHVKQIEAFEAFINTTDGKAELAKYAKKDQTIAGITFDSDGEYHKKKIDLVFTGSNGISKIDNRDGETEAKIENGRLIIHVRTNRESNIGSGLITMVHETLIHCNQYAKDYSDNKKLDNSHAYKELREFAKLNGYGTPYIHHFQELNVDKRLDKVGLKIMREYYRGAGIKKTDQQIKNLLRFVP